MRPWSSMLARHDVIRLMHMRDAASKALRISAAKSREALDREDEPLPDALIHLLSVIGEAANKVGGESRAALPEVPWAEIVGMRNRLIHAYFDIDLDILWATVQDRLPALVEVLNEGLRREQSP